jgi:hypothetical protein
MDCSIVLLIVAQSPSLLSMTCKMPCVRKPSCHSFVAYYDNAHRDPQTYRILKSKPASLHNESQVLNEFLTLVNSMLNSLCSSSSSSRYASTNVLKPTSTYSLMCSSVYFSNSLPFFASLSNMTLSTTLQSNSTLPSSFLTSIDIHFLELLNSKIFNSL